MTTKFNYLLIALCILAGTATAAPRTKAKMMEAAAKAINQHRSGKHLAPRTEPMTVLISTTSYEIIGYENGGFAIVSADDLVPEVLGVSAAPYSKGRQPFPIPPNTPPRWNLC